MDIIVSVWCINKLDMSVPEAAWICVWLVAKVVRFFQPQIWPLILFKNLCKTSLFCWGFTTGNFDFAVCTIVCRVQIHGHMSNMIFAECAQENTRQNQSTRQSHGLPWAFLWHTAKSWFVVCFFLAHGKAINFFVFSLWNFFNSSHTTCGTPC